jgi:hypothetical protein
MRLLVWVMSFVTALSLSLVAHADSLITGRVEGEYCRGFVVKACQLVDVIGVYSGNQLYTIKDRWSAVDEYSASQGGRCWLRPKGQRFQYILNGEREEGELGYITFGCRKE